MINYDELYKTIEYEFKDKKIIQEALTHPSLSVKESFVGNNYERLEFLGDAILGFVITEILISKYTDEKEGSLAKRRSALVCKEALYKISKELNLGKFILMSEGEQNCGGRNNKTNLENVLESIIGAIYVDSGIDDVRKFITRFWYKNLEYMKDPPNDPKTTLQEWAQKKYSKTPVYKVISSKGPAHSPEFTVEVKVEGMASVCASSKSKRNAERLAASLLLEQIAKNE